MLLAIVVVLVVVIVVESDVDRCDIKLLAGGAKAVVDAEIRTITAIVASSMRLDKFWMVIMLYFCFKIFFLLPIIGSTCMDEKYNRMDTGLVTTKSNDIQVVVVQMRQVSFSFVCLFACLLR